MSDAIITIENIGKMYNLRHAGQSQSYTAFRDVLAGRFKRMIGLGGPKSPTQTREEFWAVRDISLQIKSGEVVGIIGRNGAGKSTLLKILSRITEPTCGRVTLGGRIASLLEVGTGFHSELTGRENIYLNGAILGMSMAEIRSKFDTIVDFADVSRFLDTPVKHYSSGMYLRLAFAIAAHLDPEILVVDEVLAVGDAEFQKRCLGKMKDVAKSGRTVLFVSHQLNAVATLCTRCVCLVKGKVVDDGTPDDVINGYLSDQTSTEAEWTLQNEDGPSNPGFTPTRLALVNESLGLLGKSIRANQRIGVLIEGQVEAPNPMVTIGFVVYAQSGETLWWSLHTDTAPDQWPTIKRGQNRLLAWLPEHWLNEGGYRIELVALVHSAQWISQPMVNAPTVSFEIRGGLSESPYWHHVRPGLMAPVVSFESV